MAERQVYALGGEFPHEGFVQKALEQYFRSLGFEIRHEGDADLVCIHPESNQKWIIEAKGKTSSIGTDFRTGLGQILSRMSEPSVTYAVAVPDLPGFLSLCRRISGWVRKALGLHWLIVSPDGSIRVIEPGEMAITPGKEENA